MQYRKAPGLSTPISFPAAPSLSPSANCLCLRQQFVSFPCKKPNSAAVHMKYLDITANLRARIPKLKNRDQHLDIHLHKRQSPHLPHIKREVFFHLHTIFSSVISAASVLKAAQRVACKLPAGLLHPQQHCDSRATDRCSSKLTCPSELALGCQQKAEMPEMHFTMKPVA